jgi:DNA-binding NarL/FixJ family response regulator
MIRIGLVAPSLAARLGLQTLLESDPELQVRAAAGSLEAVLPRESPGLDVLVILGEQVWLQADLGLFDRGQVPAVLLLVDDPQAALALPELALHAWGLLPEDSSAEELLAAVRAVHLGLVVCPAEMLAELNDRPLLEGSPQATSMAEEVLTEREIEVLQLLALGLANKQIAAALSISSHTVKFHVSSIYSKLNASNRTEAVRLGLQNGLISL